MPYAARMLALGAVVCAVLGPLLTPWAIVVIGFVVSFTSQCVKITVDSLMQTHVPDHLLGRAFSAYDVVYNAGMVAAAALGALLLPTVRARVVAAHRLRRHLRSDGDAPAAAVGARRAARRRAATRLTGCCPRSLPSAT